LIIDVATKILADNITLLMCAAAADHADLPARSRKCNRAYAASFMQSLSPRLVLLGATSVLPSMPLAPTRSDTSLAAACLVSFVMSSLIRHAHTSGAPDVRWIGSDTRDSPHNFRCDVECGCAGLATTCDWYHPPLSSRFGLQRKSDDAVKPVRQVCVDLIRNVPQPAL
jgi:hypothetical protein